MLEEVQMKAIILAAGSGRRFWPFNEARSKCAFPILNEPAVLRLSRQLHRAGVSEQVVVVGRQSGSVRSALASSPASIVWSEQSEPLGSADAVLTGQAAAGAPGPWLVASGDSVLDQESVTAFVQAAGSGEAAALVAPGGVERSTLGCTIEQGRISSIQGGHRGLPHRPAGLYLLAAPALEYLRRTPETMTHVPVGAMPPPERELAESLALMIDGGLTVAAVDVVGFAVDLDRPWQIVQATELALAEMWAELGDESIADGASVHPTAEISGRLVLGPGARIGPRAIVRGDLFLEAGAAVTDGAVVADNCRVGQGAVVREYASVGSGSVLGARSICGHGAEFSGVLLEGAYLYHYCEIYGVVGQSVDIGAATVCGTLRFDDGEAEHRASGLRERPPAGANASYLGDFSRTGVNAILMPGVHVGSYSCVGPGVVLYEDLPSREIVTLKQTLEHRPWGPERYGW